MIDRGTPSSPPLDGPALLRPVASLDFELCYRHEQVERLRLGPKTNHNQHLAAGRIKDHDESFILAHTGEKGKKRGEFSLAGSHSLPVGIPTTAPVASTSGERVLSSSTRGDQTPTRTTRRLGALRFSPRAMRLYVVRHAQSANNALAHPSLMNPDRDSDPSLTEVGIQASRVRRAIPQGGVRRRRREVRGGEPHRTFVLVAHAPVHADLRPDSQGAGPGHHRQGGHLRARRVLRGERGRSGEGEARDGDGAARTRVSGVRGARGAG